MFVQRVLPTILTVVEIVTASERHRRLSACLNLISYRYSSTNSTNTHTAVRRLPQVPSVLAARRPSWRRQGTAQTPSRQMAWCSLLPEMSDRSVRAFCSAYKFGWYNTCFTWDLPGTELRQLWDPQWAPSRKMSPMKPEKKLISVTFLTSLRT